MFANKRQEDNRGCWNVLLYLAEWTYYRNLKKVICGWICWNDSSGTLKLSYRVDNPLICMDILSAPNEFNFKYLGNLE